MSPPPLPPGRFVDLPGRGRTWVRDTDGRGPVVLLLHGWTASADLNFFACFGPLHDAGFRVVAPDHRGHGRGLRTRRPFRMRDVADDAAALLEVLAVPRAIAVGYSMGGAVAQLLWRRHPARVGGLVLCATAPVFAESDREKRRLAAMGAMSLASRVTPTVARNAVADWALSRRDAEVGEWALDELRRNDWTAVLGAGAALGRFDSRAWLGEIDVPTSVILTREDRVVPPRRQWLLASGIRGAVVEEIDGDHAVVAVDPGCIVPHLVRAVRSVAERSDRPDHAEDGADTRT